jgi:uncharacterized protein (UPF0210 family)
MTKEIMEQIMFNPREDMEELDNSIYVENGYQNREEYLDYLREEYGVNLVNTLISVLPASEDFDGLVMELEDNNGFDFFAD